MLPHMSDLFKFRVGVREKRFLYSLAFAVLVAWFGSRMPKDDTDHAAEKSPVVEQVPDASPSIEDPEEVGSVDGGEYVAPTETFFEVVRVVDGDTFVIRTEQGEKKVRMIGVDTPETVDPRKTVQCFGKEASAFTASILEENAVRLEADQTQADTDIYGRLLRYVYLSNGELVNKMLIEEGYAHEYTYKVPYQKQAEFKAAQKKARAEGRGLWAPGVCA